MVVRAEHESASATSSLRELARHTSVLRAFVARNIRVKYKQAALGFTWVLLQPLAFLVLFTVFFGRLARIPSDGVPYAAFALSSLVPWQLVSNGLTLGGNGLIADGGLLRKLYFPREIPVLAAVGAVLPDLGVGLGLFLLLGPFLGAHLSLAILWVPALTIALLVPVIGVSLPVAALNVYYRDFRYALPLAVQLLLFASPVAYPLSTVPLRWQRWYVVANPFAGPIDGFRRALALGQAPDFTLLGLSLASGIVVLVVGYRTFKAFEPDLADVV